MQENYEIFKCLIQTAGLLVLLFVLDFKKNMKMTSQFFFCPRS